MSSVFTSHQQLAIIIFCCRRRVSDFALKKWAQTNRDLKKDSHVTHKRKQEREIHFKQLKIILVAVF